MPLTSPETLGRGTQMKSAWVPLSARKILPISQLPSRDIMKRKWENRCESALALKVLF